jgi:deoxyribodipyrimidine photo-lyase
MPALPQLLLCLSVLSIMKGLSTAMSSGPGGRRLVWFRSDLRLLDNPVLASALALPGARARDLLCLYCFDPRHFAASGQCKTAQYRAQFLTESVANLRKNLRALGSDLLVALGKPEDVIPSLRTSDCTQLDVFVQGEVTYEELVVESRVEQRLKAAGARLHRVAGGCSLFHPDDLPFRKDLQDMPDVFTPFKEKVEKRCTVRPVLPPMSPGSLLTPPINVDEIIKADCSFDYLPSLSDLGFSAEQIAACTTNLDTRTVMRFEGGEDAALARIDQWMFRDDKLKNYFDIRNGMSGEGYSSKLSPWLANGCISPRVIYMYVKRYERERGANKSTYWLIFELIWRDFFRYFCAKYGNNIFFPGGAIGKRVRWEKDEEKIRRWKEGSTGVPLVDANMRELKATGILSCRFFMTKLADYVMLFIGWMSNRGRQNVASYLVLDLNQDWRVGAEHFEAYLLDHDVCSNYGNWNAAAGLTGGRVNRFNIVKQSNDYDSRGEYIRHWIPELRAVPAPLVFEPWKLSKSEQERYGVKIGVDYPYPIAPGGGGGGGGEDNDRKPSGGISNSRGSSYTGRGSGRDGSMGGKPKFSRVQHY